MGTTTSTIKIVNNTNTHIVNTDVSGIDEFDFKEKNHPRSKLRNLSIDAKRSAERTVDLHSPASHCPVTITLIFKDKTEDTFRIDLKYVEGCCARFHHSRISHNITYRLDNTKIIITVENTAQQKNEEAEEQLKKAREAMRQQMYELALELLERAKALANQANTLADIETEESQVCSLYGEALFEEGVDLEEEENAEQAQNKFDKAKSMFKRALNLIHSKDIKLKLRLVKLKISGNEKFNKAMEFKNEASSALKNTENEQALNEFDAALDKCKEARLDYAEGARHKKEYFADSLRIVDEEIEQVSVVMSDINTVRRLDEQIGGLRVDNSARDVVDEASEKIESTVQYRFNVQH